MRRTLGIIFAGFLAAQSLGAEPERRIDFKRPILYSTSLMTVGWAALVSSGIPESGPSVNNFIDAYSSPPRMDDDSALFNYVLHPLWGSETYLRAREANFGVTGSVAFNLAASAAWEYLFESWVQHPSTQDLMITTAAGSLLGELRHRIKQRTGQRVHWWVDPIDSTLRRLKFRFGKDRSGNTELAVGFAWRF